MTDRLAGKFKLSNRAFTVAIGVTSTLLLMVAFVVAYAGSGRIAWWIAFASWWLLVGASEPRRKF